MTNKERELFEECKLQFIHIHNVIGRKQFSSTKNLIKAIDKALILPVVVRQSEQLVCDILKGTKCNDSFPSYKDGKCYSCGGQAN